MYRTFSNHDIDVDNINNNISDDNDIIITIARITRRLYVNKIVALISEFLSDLAIAGGQSTCWENLTGVIKVANYDTRNHHTTMLARQITPIFNVYINVTEVMKI